MSRATGSDHRQVMPPPAAENELPEPTSKGWWDRLSAPSATPYGRTDIAVRIALGAVQLGPFLIFLLLILAMTMLTSDFLTSRNVTNVLAQSSVIATLALGQLLVILTRGIDLSVGSVMALSIVVGALVFDDTASTFLVIGAIVATGSVVGLVNGVLYVKGRLPHPFIPTLAMLSIASGLAFVLADGQSNPGMPEAVQTLGGGEVGPIPVPALVVAVAAIAVLILTRFMVWGRWIYAVGGNADAARRAGIPVDRLLISVYVLSGLAAACAGLVLAGRTNAGYPTAGQLAELDAIAAVIIGGASFLGGRGTVVNALIGALTIGVIRNGMNLLGVDPFYQLVVIGFVIVVAVELDVVRQTLEGKLRVLRARVEP